VSRRLNVTNHIAVQSWDDENKISRAKLACSFTKSLKQTCLLFRNDEGKMSHTKLGHSFAFHCQFLALLFQHFVLMTKYKIFTV